MTSYYISPAGSGTSTSQGSPGGWNSTEAVLVAGDIMWFTDGTYNMNTIFGGAKQISRQGAAGNHIKYAAVNPGGAIITSTAGAAHSCIQLAQTGGNVGCAYRTFEDLYIDCNDTMNNGIGWTWNGLGSIPHHCTINRCRIWDGVSSACSGTALDYLTVTNCDFHRCGYVNPAWSSGISLGNSVHNAAAFDAYSGFHNIFANNRISGMFDVSVNHSDGNGIILDINIKGNTLMANNLIYHNGACGINILTPVAGVEYWLVNNTVYGSDLDTNQSSHKPEFSINGSAGTFWFVNNIARPTVASGRTFSQIAGFANSTTGINYRRNIGFGGLGVLQVPSSVTSDPEKYRTVDPLFVNPPSLAADSNGPENAIAPWNIGTALRPQATSPALGQGVDPRTLTTDANKKADMTTWLLTDLAGAARPQ